MTHGEKYGPLLRGGLSTLFIAVAGYVVLALFGWFDGPSQRADSEARKCGSARSINLLGDAQRYCGNASGVVALVHTEAAALAIVQERLCESAAHCRFALLAWRDQDDERRENTVAIPEDVRQESIHACEHLIAAATRQPPPVARVSDMQHDVGTRVSAPMVLMLKANELRAQRRTERAL